MIVYGDDEGLYHPRASALRYSGPLAIGVCRQPRPDEFRSARSLPALALVPFPGGRAFVPRWGAPLSGS